MTTEDRQIIYKNVEIKKINNKFRLISPQNNTLRIFTTIEKAMYYIDNAEAIDSHAAALGRDARS